MRLSKAHKFPEENLVTASRLIAASTMATPARMPQTDKNFESVKAANGNELAACRYSIDETNANHKLLKNHLEELKL